MSSLFYGNDVYSGFFKRGVSMSTVSDAFGGLQTALVAKLTQMQSKDFFIQDPVDPTSIKTIKNVKVIGTVTARGDLLGNEDIT